MFQPRHTAEQRQTVLDVYGTGASCRAAADAAGVSNTWAYQVLRRAGVIRRQRQRRTYPAFILRRARELYPAARSCRAVAEQLAREYPGQAPPPKWVEKHLRRLGETRSRGESLLLRHRCEERVAAAARLLEAGLSPQDVMRKLGVSRDWLRRRLGPGRRPAHLDELMTCSGAYWARNAERRALRVRAGELRLAGMAGPAIARELGVPPVTVYAWLRADLPSLARRQTKAERRRAA